MSTSSRDALARGETREWLDTLGPDEIDHVVLDLPIGGINATFARIGRSIVLIDNSDEVQIMLGGSEDEARAAYQENVNRIKGQAAILQGAAAEGPKAFVAALMGMAANEAGPVAVPVADGLPRVDRSPVVREVSNDGTGFYM